MLDQFTDPHERNEAVKRFKAEADILQRLRHPCIPNIYDIFEDQGYHYLVMEFVRGSDLEDIIRRERYIPEVHALQWADQMCDVLEYLHRQQPPIIFRDLKPSNIMIDSDGNVKLIDFGIAKVFQPLQVGTQIGTPGYAPPEQYQGIATPASDIFALGATLHHMLTGRDPRHEPPFSFPPVYALRPDISRRTSDAIQKALQMKVEDRYQSVAEFRQALLPSILPTIPLPTRKRPQPSSTAALPTQPSAPSSRTHVTWFGVGAAIATVLVLGVLWMFGIVSGGDPPPTPISGPAPTLTAVGSVPQPLPTEYLPIPIPSPDPTLTPSPAPMRAIRNLDLWYRESTHAVLMRSNR